MRHNVAHRKLGRVTEHRLAMLRNQAISLLRHERIETTIPKAKELRPFVERLITIAKRGLAAGDANARTLNARRMVLAEIARHRSREQAVQRAGAAVRRSSRRLHPHPADRFPPRRRRRDGADRARGQRVDARPRQPKEGEDAEAPKKSKGLGERLRQTARNLRGGGKDGGSKAAASGQTRGGRKTTTPRKVGGS